MNPMNVIPTVGVHTKTENKGVKQSVVIYDILTESYVQFPSKAEVGLFMYGIRGRGQT